MGLDQEPTLYSTEDSSIDPEKVYCIWIMTVINLYPLLTKKLCSNAMVLHSEPSGSSKIYFDHLVFSQITRHCVYAAKNALFNKKLIMCLIFSNLGHKVDFKLQHNKFNEMPKKFWVVTCQIKQTENCLKSQTSKFGNTLIQIGILAIVIL